jgi:hypothetical protein
MLPLSEDVSIKPACLFLLPVLVALAPAGDWPESYAELDTLLSTRSAKYKALADDVRKRQPYRILPTDEFPLANVKDGDGELVIEINPRVPPGRRPTLLIWEMANAYQRPNFQEISRRAIAGEIASAREYGLRMEIVEHGSHRLHREVLEELSEAGIPITGDFLFFLNPQLKSLDEYQIPSAHDYLEAQAKSGHTRHYERWYYRITKKPAPPEP